MSLIITADHDGNASVDNGLYRSSMSMIIAPGSNDSACVEHGLYESAMPLFIAAVHDHNAGVEKKIYVYITDSDGNGVWRMTYIDHLCH